LAFQGLIEQQRASAGELMAAELARLAAEHQGEGVVVRKVAEFYAAREYHAFLLEDARWSPLADTVLAVLSEAEDHAFERGFVHPEEWQRSRASVERAVEQQEAGLAGLLDPTRWKGPAEVSCWGEGPDALLQRMDEHPETQVLVQQWRDLEASWREQLVDTARLEWILSVELGHFASELRLSHPSNAPGLERFADLGLNQEGIWAARLGAFYRRLGEGCIEQVLDGLYPPHPQYRALLAARHRYAEQAAAGGWPPISVKKAKKLKLGQADPVVPAVRERLALEGYELGGSSGQDLDSALGDAIALYRRTHQLSPSSEIDAALIKNLNLSVYDRLAKIDVTLARYRSSIVGAFRHYIFVNLSDFHGELWSDGELVHRFAIVIGNNDVQKDPNTGKTVIDPSTQEPVYPNRTPIQTGWLSQVIYNPYWNVPARIRIEELEPNLGEDPFWYENNGYEVVFPDEPKRMYVRQLPGRSNALGQVKFIFPNPHDVYLHDTPAKALFKRPVRAFSHGCMRVQDPLDLAEAILRHDGQWDERRVRSILTVPPLTETPLTLKRKIPIHIDYMITRVDESGHVAFLSDIYRYERAAINRREAWLLERYGVEGVVEEQE
jgi:murein L,D-transpeptidase YcbB/YkuD